MQSATAKAPALDERSLCGHNPEPLLAGTVDAA
jgi:hypothetical protein